MKRAKADDAAVLAPAEQYADLLGESQRLLGKVAVRRRELQRLDNEMQEDAARLAERVEPLADSIRALDNEVHALFTALLDDGEMSLATRKQVRGLYEWLQGDGGISARTVSSSLSRAIASESPGSEAAEERSSEEEAIDPAAAEALRALFLRLARALHPDGEEQAEETAALTDTMKEVSEAYREGDVARLLEIERRWVDSARPMAAAPAIAVRVQQLQATIVALEAQLRSLERRCREIKDSELRMLLRTKRRNGQAELVKHAEEELARMEELRDFVLGYQAGKIPLQKFLAGPAGDDQSTAAVDYFALGSKPLKDVGEVKTSQPEKSAGKRSRKPAQGRKSPAPSKPRGGKR